MMESGVNNKLSGLVVGMILFCYLIFFPAVEAAEHPYILDADVINYDYENQELIAENEVFFSAPGLELEAEKLTLYLPRNQIDAQGSPLVLQTETDKLTGERLIYNYRTGQGEIFTAESEVEDLYFSGRRISLTGEEEHFTEIDQAVFTPCIKPDPHYRFEAEKVIIHPDDKVVAEDVSFYWGETRIFGLDSYVLYYQDDPETGERKLSPPVPTYEIGYDSKKGLFLELEYAYQLFDRTSGRFFYTNTQRGRSRIEAENSTVITEKLELDTEYFQQEIDEPDPEQEELAWEESFKTVLTYTPAPFFQIKTGYNYLEENLNITEYVFAGWEHELTENLILSGEQQFKQEYADGQQGQAEVTRPLELALTYDPGPLYLRYEHDYDFQTAAHRQQYTYNDRLADEINVSFYQDYQDGNLARHSYQVRGSNFLNWSLRYRDGYNLNYLPFLTFNRSLPEGFKMAAGLGRLEEKGYSTGKVEINPSWSQEIEITPKWAVAASGSYNWHYYVDGDSRSQYGTMTTGIGLKFQQQLSPKLNVSGSLRQERTWSSGEPALNRDRKTIQERIWPELNITLETPQPESELRLNFGGRYDRHLSEWGEMGFGLHRQLDCYSYGIQVDVFEPAVTFSFDLSL
ncbi:MAG: hypothetical protein ACQEQG_07795 [Bacillota bacterium]